MSDSKERGFWGWMQRKTRQLRGTTSLGSGNKSVRRPTSELRERFAWIKNRALDEVVSRLCGRSIRTTPKRSVPESKTKLTEVSAESTLAGTRSDKLLAGGAEVQPLKREEPKPAEPQLTEPRVDGAEVQPLKRAEPQLREPELALETQGNQSLSRNGAESLTRKLAQAEFRPAPTTATTYNKRHFRLYLLPRGGEQVFVSWSIAGPRLDEPMHILLRKTAGAEAMSVRPVSSPIGEMFLQVPTPDAEYVVELYVGETLVVRSEPVRGVPHSARVLGAPRFVQLAPIFAPWSPPSASDVVPNGQQWGHAAMNDDTVELQKPSWWPEAGWPVHAHVSEPWRAETLDLSGAAPAAWTQEPLDGLSLGASDQLEFGGASDTWVVSSGGIQPKDFGRAERTPNLVTKDLSWPSSAGWVHATVVVPNAQLHDPVERPRMHSPLADGPWLASAHRPNEQIIQRHLAGDTPSIQEGAISSYETLVGGTYLAPQGRADNPTYAHDQGHIYTPVLPPPMPEMREVTPEFENPIPKPPAVRKPKPRAPSRGKSWASMGVLPPLRTPPQFPKPRPEPERPPMPVPRAVSSVPVVPNGRHCSPKPPAPSVERLLLRPKEPKLVKAKRPANLDRLLRRPNPSV